MNRHELMLRDCKRRFGEIQTFALVTALYADAKSKSEKQKLIRTAAAVLSMSDVKMKELVEGFDNIFKSTTVRLHDGTPILDGGEYVFKGFDDGGLQ
ncbi:MAG: hypothetical protein N5P05_004583 [Chroococcopsis gigantea SAG 12.99]|jgi:hypothetical protein|nr:hypothetical protein [Chroococcopsis gigantea SAG 12.99]